MSAPSRAQAAPSQALAAARAALTRGRGRLGAATLVALALAAAVGPFIVEACTGARYDAQDLALGCVPPCLRHPFGTDTFGRDLLVRVLCGLRLSLAVGTVAAVLSVAVGTAVGSLSGYLGGLVDGLTMRIVDVLYTLPFVFVVILLTSIFGRSTILLFVGLGAVSWLSCARVVRGQVQRLRNSDLTAALTVMGASRARILWVHLVPNVAGVVVVLFTLTVPAMVLEEAFLSYLGLGVQAPTPSLGSLLLDGTGQMLLAWWQLAFPASALATLLVALNLVGDALQAALDPRRL